MNKLRANRTNIRRAAAKLRLWSDSIARAHKVGGSWPDGTEHIRIECEEMESLARMLYGHARDVPSQRGFPF